jgi:hypothetical protein
MEEVKSAIGSFLFFSSLPLAQSVFLIKRSMMHRHRFLVPIMHTTRRVCNVPPGVDYMGKGCIIRHKIKISVNSGKDSTSTLSLVIHRARLKKNLQKSTLAFKGG